MKKLGRNEKQQEAVSIHIGRIHEVSNIIAPWSYSFTQEKHPQEVEPQRKKLAEGIQ